jgi:peptidoglycan hydrolase CwlO-like protein
MLFFEATEHITKRTRKATSKPISTLLASIEESGFSIRQEKNKSSSKEFDFRKSILFKIVFTFNMAQSTFHTHSSDKIPNSETILKYLQIIREDLAIVKTAVDGMTADMNDIKISVKDLQSEVKILKTDMKNIKNELDGMKTGIRDLQSRI